MPAYLNINQVLEEKKGSEGGKWYYSLYTK